MPRRDWRLRVDDIIEAIERIREFTEEMTLEVFERDPKAIQAVAYNLVSIGEATAGIPEEIREQHAGLPWQKMRAMRNVVVQEYFLINPPKNPARTTADPGDWWRSRATW